MDNKINLIQQTIKLVVEPPPPPIKDNIYNGA